MSANPPAARVRRPVQGQVQPPAVAPAHAPAQREEFVYDSTNERLIIEAAIGADKKARGVLVRTVSPDEMLLPDHSLMWRALRVMVDQNLDYDPQVMRQLIKDEGGHVELEYVTGIEEGAVVPANLEYHLSRLKVDSTRARILDGAVPVLLRDLKNPKASVNDMRASAMAVLRALDGAETGRRFMHRPAEMAREYKAELAARRVAGNFYPTGFAALDAKMTEGAAPQRTALIVGLSNSGKSTFTGSFAMSLAEQGRKVLYGCWEMTSKSMMDVMVAAKTRVPLEKIVQGTYDDAEAVRIERAVDYITKRIIFMDNPFFAELRRGQKRSNERSLDLLEGYVAESGCDVLVMDLWERMLTDLSPEGVTMALYAQQDMHVRYNLYGVIVHQLRLKDVEQRRDKRPTREGIKGTSAYVEVPDQVFGVHREAQFKDVVDDSMEIINLKQRKGKAFWAVRFDWRGDLALVTGGVETPYNPGLEAGSSSGDVGDLRTGGGQRKPSRREK